MDNEFISKKELLELTGISYGQLYRWKRKNILPEEWFIKKSSYTGQETFFPREKILDRINKIKNMKDDLSLDDIAGMFSPDSGNIQLNNDDITSMNVISKATFDIFIEYGGVREVYTFENLMQMKVLEKFLRTGAVNEGEVKEIIDCMEKSYNKFNGRECELIFIRKLGMPICIISMLPNEFYIGEPAKIIQRVSISNCIEELKLLIK